MSNLLKIFTAYNLIKISFVNENALRFLIIENLKIK